MASECSLAPTKCLHASFDAEERIGRFGTVDVFLMTAHPCVRLAVDCGRHEILDFTALVRTVLARESVARSRTPTLRRMADCMMMMVVAAVGCWAGLGVVSDGLGMISDRL
jgi:hypothetical protein